VTTLATLRAPEFQALADITVLLPVGSTEQHSTHLPMGTDAIIAEAICTAAAGLSDTVVSAPALPYGASEHHRGLPGGALSLRPRILVDVMVALMEQILLAPGNRALLIVNGHGGNWPAITCAVDEFGSLHGERRAGACSWWHLVPDVIEAEIGAADPGIGHAGACETSAMLALRPASVALEHALEGSVVKPDGASDGGLAPAALHRWLDFSQHFPGGVVGSPRAASAEAGATIVNAAAARLAALADSLRQGPPA
jgi:creatinine amidohydrolase/Fe(II)-dependent formamide hydrolase-like protein